MQSLEALKQLAALDRDRIEQVLTMHNRLRAAGEFEALSDCYCEQAELELLGNPRYFAYAGRYRGRPAVIEAFRRMGTEVQFIEAEIRDILVDCDRAMMRTHARLRHRGTGLSLEHEIWDIFRFDNGLIAHQTKLIDLQAFNRLSAGQ